MPEALYDISTTYTKTQSLSGDGIIFELRGQECPRHTGKETNLNS